ncbi:MAG: uracil-DNA glycosylase [Lactobacillaceae bacterium]|jgi:DNA polymerase|nr:uracil-DNA glycosylase [Lactobacillaceae bacterium]
MINSLENILEWYIESGVDETVGDIPFSLEKKAVEPQAGAPVTASSRQATTNLAQATIAARQSSRETAEKARNLDELKELVKSFDGCSLKLTATNTVFGYGSEKAKIMFIGEAPGADEDRIGKPFVGRSGQLLDKMLAAIGIKREDCFISNVLPWRPPGNRTPTDSEKAVCLPFLKKQIELVSPEYIFILGGSAANSLFDNMEPISKLRGRWLEYKTENGKIIKVLASFHPAYLLRNAGQKAKAWSDFLRLKKNIC